MLQQRHGKWCGKNHNDKFAKSEHDDCDADVLLCLANQQDLLGGPMDQKAGSGRAVGRPFAFHHHSCQRARALFPHITRVCPNTEET